MQQNKSRLRGWTRSIVDIAVILLAVTAAKTAIAEPYLHSVRLDGADTADRR